MSYFDEIDSLLAPTNQEPRLSPAATGRRWIEDRFAAQEVIRERYENLGVAKPRFVWAPSPAALHGAIELLRQVHHGQTHNMVDALVPMGNPVETAMKRTALTAMLDPDITVTMGASMQRQMWATGSLYGDIRIVHAFLDRFFKPQNLERKVAPAGWADAVVYGQQSGSTIVADQCFCFLPYAKMVWFCQPGRYDAGSVLFQDGFRINLSPEVEEHKRIEAARSQARLSLPWRDDGVSE